jgi:hypothetical protein
VIVALLAILAVVGGGHQVVAEEGVRDVVTKPEELHPALNNCGFNAIEIVSQIIQASPAGEQSARDFLAARYPLAYQLSVLEIQTILRDFGCHVDAFKCESITEVKGLLAADKVAILYGIANHQVGHYFVARLKDGRTQLIDYPNPPVIFSDGELESVNGFKITPFVLVCSRGEHHSEPASEAPAQWHPISTQAVSGDAAVSVNKVGPFMVPSLAEASLDPSDPDLLIVNFEIKNESARRIRVGSIKGNCGCFREAHSSIKEDAPEKLAITATFSRFRFNPAGTVELGVELLEENGGKPTVIVVPVVWHQQTDRSNRVLFIPDVLVFASSINPGIVREFSVYLPNQGESPTQVPKLDGACIGMFDWQYCTTEKGVVVGEGRYDKYTYRLRLKEAKRDPTEKMVIDIVFDKSTLGKIPIHLENW